MITGILQNRGLAIHQADTSIRITCPDFSGSRLCFPAFVLELKRRMAEMLAGAGL
jgi:hypothetical protein